MFGVEEKRVVSPRAVQFDDPRRSARRSRKLMEFPALRRRIEPVAREAREEILRLRAGKAPALEEIHRPREIEEAVGVEPLGELVALVVEVALDLKLRRKRYVPRPLLNLPSELPLEALPTEKGKMADHPSHGQPLCRRIVGGILSPSPLRVAHDSLPCGLVEPDLHRAMRRARRRRPHLLHRAGKPQRHFDRLQSAHAPPTSGMESTDSERLDQPSNDFDRVAQGDLGEPHAVGPSITSGCGGAGRPLAGPQTIRADHKVPLRVDGLAGPDDSVPPPHGVRIARYGMKDQDRVAPVGVQFTPRLISDGHLGKRAAQFTGEAADIEVGPRVGVRLGPLVFLKQPLFDGHRSANLPEVLSVGLFLKGGTERLAPHPFGLRLVLSIAVVVGGVA